MFILYSIVFGLILGLILRGRVLALGELRIQWAPLIVVGFTTQIVLFSDAVAARVGDLGPALYVGSTLMVGVAVLRNVSIPGIPLILLGAISNMTAILANGGFMPTAPGAAAALGKSAPVIYSNSAIVARPAFEPLTDLFALPSWAPFANVFSVGDVLIGIGVVVLMATTMRRSPRPSPGTSSAGRQPAG
jgi:hypothetical protein